MWDQITNYEGYTKYVDFKLTGDSKRRRRYIKTNTKLVVKRFERILQQGFSFHYPNQGPRDGSYGRFGRPTPRYPIVIVRIQIYSIYLWSVIWRREDFCTFERRRKISPVFSGYTNFFVQSSGRLLTSREVLQRWESIWYYEGHPYWPSKNTHVTSVNENGTLSKDNFFTPFFRQGKKPSSLFSRVEPVPLVASVRVNIQRTTILTILKGNISFIFRYVTLI